MKSFHDQLPDWERLLAAERHLQHLVPSAVLVGGAAAAVHAGAIYGTGPSSPSKATRCSRNCSIAAEVSTWRALYQLARTDRRFEKVIAFQDVASFVRATADDLWVARSSVRTCYYNLPFAAFRGKRISSRNRFVSIVIDQQLGRQGATFVLADGTEGDLPADLVLYYCDPTYDWSPINQLKRVLRDKLDASKLSVRVLADALRTSPSQVLRLLEENRASRQLVQLLRLAELAGYRVTFSLKRKRAA